MPLRPTFTGGIAIFIALTGAAHSEVSPLDLVEPVADYKIFVSERLEKLVVDAKAFTDAIKAGNLDKAKSLYGPARVNYETIEPIAELFNDLDNNIDSRADDHEKREEDPDFRGFHRLEYGLFARNSLVGLPPIADKLMEDILDLRKRVADLTLPPDKVVGGAAELLEEVAAKKISGEEDRYAHTDLWDFRANVDGAQKIFDLTRGLIEKSDGAFVAKVAKNFATVDRTLDKYKKANGYETYEKLSDRDRKVLAAAVNTLAEDLSTLRGKLGLD